MNIIFLISDTFRYDNLFDRSPVMPVRTPNLDRFHQRAVSCERMVLSSFPTIPHRTDLTSGRHGWPWYGWQKLPAAANHIPRLLGPKGYASQLICDCPHLFKHDFQVGFDAALHLRGQEIDAPFLRLNHPVEHSMPPELTRTEPEFFGRNVVDTARWTNRNWRLEVDRFAPRTAETTVEWLEENYQYESFFLWVDFFDPHEPWDPPEYMVKRYDPDYDGPPMLHPNYGPSSDYSPEQLRNLRAHYCAEAEMVDRWVGRVLDKIDDLRLWDNSVVVFTSDHGFSLGEHGKTGKANIHPRETRRWPLYPEVAHVPCLVAAPGLKGGRSVDAPLTSADILPTALDLAGVEVDPAQPFHGRSFAPLARGETNEPLYDHVIAGSYTHPGTPDHKRRPSVVYTDRWAYATLASEGDRPELFDLAADPVCETNVLDDHLEVARDIHARALDWLTSIEAPSDTIDIFNIARP